MGHTFDSNSLDLGKSAGEFTAVTGQQQGKADTDAKKITRV